MLYIDIFAILILGLLMGALLFEGAVLVPYWQRMAADDFLELHGTLGPHLHRFFTPLTIGGTLLPGIAALARYLLTGSVSLAAIMAALLAASMMAIYFLHFKSANESFEQKTVTADELPKILARWGNWHWLRVILGIVAFALMLLALTVQ